uniref:Uncharacterized protein n=1 Tax=Photinus pyralis TaxID=7054 RepID=A0A1Y1KXN6_PHOPY
MDKKVIENCSQEERIPEALENVVGRANRTEFDAVHRRFTEPKDPKLIREYQVANDYYCDQCRLFFAPDVVGLRTHFKEDMVRHRPVGNCFYCNGPVYAYYYNNNRRIHHNCRNRNQT